MQLKNDKPTLHLIFMSMVFIFIGFTTFAMVIIRANENPPMNENEPDKFTELVSYLNSEQYGDFPTFKRRFASEPHQRVVYNNYSQRSGFFLELPDEPYDDKIFTLELCGKRRLGSG